jgi:hypothetical protein
MKDYVVYLKDILNNIKLSQKFIKGWIMKPSLQTIKACTP